MKNHKIFNIWNLITFLIIIGFITYFVFQALHARNSMEPLTTLLSPEERIKIKLPQPIYTSSISVEEALNTRRSYRRYRNGPLTLQDISQLVWSAQGITSTRGFRTAPSAGGIYPMEVYVASYNVTDLPVGLYHYLPAEHALEFFIKGDLRERIAGVALDQASVRNGDALIIIAADFQRNTQRYGARGSQYIYMEAGHISENVYLQCVTLKLGTVSVGAFDDVQIKRVLNIPYDTIYLMPIGKI